MSTNELTAEQEAYHSYAVLYFIKAHDHGLAVGSTAMPMMLPQVIADLDDGTGVAHGGDYPELGPVPAEVAEAFRTIKAWERAVWDAAK